ncbi:Oidioi.mRNA.OKI2018_I69.chr1.g299.t1.cds [Oikopleura dioica]|uniref:Oidioi.mRNA.OKI2018_I69.chr1.g299.t1.cds n=1 Tax=Oikopleura dioica TaxID=34765 RepID=A0ABN7SJF0_OIKDI|nr:Oidioi.mRNA.OKI2018_I69.chr1.g299.t1.cds [Oikopleura dioica]
MTNLKYCNNVASRRPSGFRLSQVKEETEDDLFVYNSHVELLESSSSSIENNNDKNCQHKSRENKRKQSMEKKMLKLLTLLCSASTDQID